MYLLNIAACCPAILFVDNSHQPRYSVVCSGRGTCQRDFPPDDNIETWRYLPTRVSTPRQQRELARRLLSPVLTQTCSHLFIMATAATMITLNFGKGALMQPWRSKMFARKWLVAHFEEMDIPQFSVLDNLRKYSCCTEVMPCKFMLFT